MRTSAAVVACLVSYTSAHGLVTQITGANGVVMPGLSGRSRNRSPNLVDSTFADRIFLSFPTVADGTPRDCSSNGCGSQADTAIVRDGEIASGEVGPLGRTQGNGPIDAAAMINVFMGNAAASTIGTNSANSGVGVEDDLSAARNNDDKKRSSKMRARQFNLGGLLGGLGGGAGGGAGGLLGGLTGGGGAAAGVKSAGAPESLVASTAGSGAETGLPTANEDGTVDMTFRQVSL